MTLRDTEVIKMRSENRESRKRQQQQQQPTNKQKHMACIFPLPTKTGASQGAIILNKMNWTRSLLTECLCGYVAKKKLSIERGTWIISYFFSECNKLLILFHDQLFKHATVGNGMHFSWITPAWPGFRTILKQSIQIKNEKCGSKTQQCLT